MKSGAISEVDKSIIRSWPRWPSFTAREVDAVSRVIRSNQLFAAAEVRMFEQDFANYLGINFAVGVGNATQGLHLALSAMGIGEGDEVIVTNSSWISTASCILMQNAVPVFVDIEPETLGLNPELLNKMVTQRTKAVIAVHILGYPSKIDQIQEFCLRNNLLLIEDASHAPGASLKGKKLGTFGDISVFSLQQRKAISTGDGGIVCTNDESFATTLRKQRSFGDSFLSYNYRMTEFAAALGRLGLEKLDRDNEQRRASAEFLASLFKDHPGIKVRLSRKNEVGVYYAIAIEINLLDSISNKILEYCISLGLPMRTIFPPLNKHPHFANHPIPARGLPWMHPNYSGFMKDVNYSDLDFPISYEYCLGRVLELYAHPGTDEAHLESFSRILMQLYDFYSSGNTRDNW